MGAITGVVTPIYLGSCHPKDVITVKRSYHTQSIIAVDEYKQAN